MNKKESKTLEFLEETVPGLRDCISGMPARARELAFVKSYGPGEFIHHKDTRLPYFGIVATGENRVINIFRNGKTFMIETNQAIDFIGEVTVLARQNATSVTIQAVTESDVIYIPREEAEKWLDSDIRFLERVTRHVAFKLYRSSYANGMNMFYPPAYILADYLARSYEQITEGSTRAKKRPVTIPRTREWIVEELGMNIKTLEYTVRNLRDEGYFDVKKGKITISPEQYSRLKEFIERSKG